MVPGSRRAALVAICVLTLAQARASAEPAPDAERLLDEGTRLFTEDADHDAAREAFARSYDLDPSWRALNGIALTYQEQGHDLLALDSYERLLAEFEAALTDAQRATVHARIAAIEARIAVVELEATQPGIEVSIDGEPYGPGPLRAAIRLRPGRHSVVATLDGHRPSTEVVVVEPGERRRLAITLARQEERVVVQLEPVRLERRLPTWIPWAALTGGAALLAVGASLDRVAAHDFDVFDASVEASAGEPPRPVRGDPERRERAELERRLAIGGYVAGAVGVVAGAFLLAINQPRRIEVAPRSRGVVVTLRF